MKHTDPKYIGPGYWASFHRRSIYADTNKKKDQVARSIIIDIHQFPCGECKDHAIKYLENNSIKDAINSNEKTSLFKWSVDFHNNVNSRLGKEIINVEKAFSMWSKEGVCTKNSDKKALTTNQELDKYKSFLMSNF